MKNRDMLLSAMLTAVLGIALLIAALLDIFAPAMILPRLDIVNMTLLSLIALVLDALIVPGAKRCYICIPVFAALSFGLLPFAAGLIAAGDTWKYALMGAAVFTSVTWLYTSAVERMTSGEKSWRTVIITAVVFYLAAQGFAGMGL